MITSRTLSTWVWVAASISMTSMSRPCGDLDAGVARAARIGGRPLLAVQPAREDARGGRLADAARAREDERLGDAAARDGVAQRLRDAALADDVVEALGAPLAGENLVAGHGMQNALKVLM